MKTKTRSILALRPLLLAGAALLLLVAAPRRAIAAFVFTLTQSGGNVVVNGSGMLNLTALSSASTGSNAPLFQPSTALLYVGPTGNSSYALYQGGGLSGPTTFGAGGTVFPSSGTGSFVGIIGRNGAQGLIVPAGYTSGTALTDSDTYTGATFASLGFTPGTYTYTWGTGANADSLTVTSAVPEPGTWTLRGVGAGMFALATLRRRRSRMA